MRISSGGEGLPKVRCWRATSVSRFLRAQRARRVSGQVLQMGIQLCSARRWARRTACARFGMALRSAFLEKFSCTMSVRGLLGGVSVMRSRGGASVMVSATALLLLFRHSANSRNAQEEHLATSPSLVTRLHLPHAIVVRLHVRKSNVVILTPETAGTVGV